jgi:hypothetical protein
VDISVDVADIHASSTYCIDDRWDTSL